MSIDFRAPFGDDLVVGARPDVEITGLVSRDFDFIEAREELIQRIIRRLLTAKGEWIPFPNYGASLRLMVNETLTQQKVFEIKNTIINQIMLEPDISSNPPPQVDIKAIVNGVFVTIRLFTRAFQPISFSFNPSAPDTFTTTSVGRV